MVAFCTWNFHLSHHQIIHSWCLFSDRFSSFAMQMEELKQVAAPEWYSDGDFYAVFQQDCPLLLRFLPWLAVTFEVLEKVPQVLFEGRAWEKLLAVIAFEGQPWILRCLLRPSSFWTCSCCILCFHLLLAWTICCHRQTVAKRACCSFCETLSCLQSSCRGSYSSFSTAVPIHLIQTSLNNLLISSYHSCIMGFWGFA